MCTFNTSVLNDGDVDAGSFRTGWYLSTNTTISTTDILVTYATQGSLLKNHYVNESGSKDLDDMSSSIPAGTYYAGVYIDYQKSVSEKNESDNTGHWTSPRIT